MLGRSLRERAPQNFGVSFSIISILTGITPMFLFGLVSTPQGICCLCWCSNHDEFQTTGGPAVMVWGFIVVGGALLIVLSSAIYQVLYSLLHDVGRLGYGRYVLRLSGRPQGILFVTQLQKYVAHIRPVVAHITGRP